MQQLILNPQVMISASHISALRKQRYFPAMLNIKLLTIDKTHKQYP